jgi:hypothetical protein
VCAGVWCGGVGVGGWGGIGSVKMQPEFRVFVVVSLWWYLACLWFCDDEIADALLQGRR